MSGWLLEHRTRQYSLHFRLLSSFDYQSRPVLARQFRRRRATLHPPILPGTLAGLSFVGTDSHIAANIGHIGRTDYTALGHFLVAAVRMHFDQEHSADRNHTGPAALVGTDFADYVPTEASGNIAGHFGTKATAYSVMEVVAAAAAAGAEVHSVEGFRSLHVLLVVHHLHSLALFEQTTDAAAKVPLEQTVLVRKLDHQPADI